MNLSSSAVLLLVVPVALAAGAPRLFAQANGPQRGSNGLFVGGRIDPQIHQKLDITLSSTGAYDSDTPEEVRTAGLGVPGTAGYSSIFSGAVDYSLQGRRVQLRAFGNSSLRHFPPFAETVHSFSTSASHTAGVGFAARLPGKTTVLLNQTVRSSPSYLYNLFPNASGGGPENAPPAAPSPAPDYALTGSQSRAASTTMTLTHDVTSRTGVSATADYQYSEMPDGTAGGRPVQVYGIRGQVSHRLARNTRATAEYFSRIGGIGYGGVAATEGKLTERGVEIAADYRLPLSATRFVALGARFGASNMMIPESAAEVGMGGRHDSRLSGQATMSYDFGRTWQARAIYHRGVEYMAGLTEPVSADGFTASVDGLLTHRVDVLATASYSSGKSALNPDASVFDTYTANLRLRYALARVFAVYGEYVYYVYDSRGSLPLAPGIPAGLANNGARVGLTLSVPALRR